MEERMKKLEKQLAEILERVNKAEFIQWLASPCTKAILIQLQLDSEQLMYGWANGRFGKRDGLKSEGQAAYALGLAEEIKSLKDVEADD